MQIDKLEVTHKGKTYTITVKSTNKPSKEATEDCNKYINNLMRNA